MKENKYDLLIDINLNLLGNKESHSEFYDYFEDENGNRLEYYEIQPKTIANEMLNHNLIEINGENCLLTREGIEIFNNGGWLKYLNLLKENNQTNEELSFLREKMNDQISVLTLKNLKHEDKIRNQKDRIRDLDEQLKAISLLKKYWLLILGFISFGAFLSKILF
jgi:hypothetical protein